MTAGRSAVLLVALAAAGAANAASAVFYDTTTGAYGYSMNKRMRRKPWLASMLRQ